MYPHIHIYTQELTSGKHKKILKAPPAHGRGRLARYSLVLIVQDDDLPLNVSLIKQFKKFKIYKNAH